MVDDLFLKTEVSETALRTLFDSNDTPEHEPSTTRMLRSIQNMEMALQS